MLYRISPRKNKPRHILLKQIKVKFKVKLLEATRKKTTNYIQQKPNKINR